MRGADVEIDRDVGGGIEALLQVADGWRGLDPTSVAESLLAMLVEHLNLAFATLRFNETAHLFVRTGEDFAPIHAAGTLAAEVLRWLDHSPAGATSVHTDAIHLGGAPIAIASVPLGDQAPLGVLVVGAPAASRPRFPTRSERTHLRLAAAHASLACRETRDLSDRLPAVDPRVDKPTGQALAESESRLHLIINTIPAMAWSATADGMLDFCNQHFLDYVGLSSAEILGLGFYRIFHPDDLERLLASWQEIMASGTTRGIDGRLRGADGLYRWFTLRQNPLRGPDGQVVKWYGVVLDIEDRKLAEERLQEARGALQASERNLRLIVDTLPVLAWVARPDGSAEFVNRRWAEYAGVPAEQILEWGFLDFYHPQDVEGMVTIWKDALESKDHMGLKGRIRRFDGEYRWFYFSGRKIVDANGLERWVGANVEFEDLQRAEDALRQSQNELARVARMTTLGELAVSIAHEVNQPLMAIVTNAGTCMRWLDDSQFDASRARQAAERVVRDGHRAGEIVAGIRALARKSPARMAPMDLNEAIRDVLLVLGGEFRRRRVDVAFLPEEATLPVLGDRTQLQQVALNLLMNSLEAMLESTGGGITLRTGRADGIARVQVLDTGSGVQDEDVERIFEAFFSTKSAGIGMGLSICRSIVDAHGGTLSLARNPPQGSVFSFTVPLASGTAG